MENGNTIYNYYIGFFFFISGFLYKCSSTRVRAPAIFSSRRHRFLLLLLLSRLPQRPAQACVISQPFQSMPSPPALIDRSIDAHLLGRRFNFRQNSVKSSGNFSLLRLRRDDRQNRCCTNIKLRWTPQQMNVLWRRSTTITCINIASSLLIHLKLLVSAAHRNNKSDL